jgi:hypothetical protein
VEKSIGPRRPSSQCQPRFFSASIFRSMPALASATILNIVTLSARRHPPKERRVLDALEAVKPKAGIKRQSRSSLAVAWGLRHGTVL